MRRASATPSIRSYVRAIDAELLDVGWRRRRRYLADAAQHLAEVASDDDLEEPAAYARAFRAALDLPPREPVPVERGLLHVWPTPAAWVLVGVAGVVLVVAALLAAQVAERVVFAGAGLQPALRQAAETVLPVPRILGSRYVGMAILVAGWVAAQLVTGAVLRYRPRWCLAVSLAAAGVIAAVAVTAVLLLA